MPVLGPENMEDAKRFWEAYKVITDTLSSGNYTNGDVLFIISVMIGEMLRDEDFDLEDLLTDIRETALATIKAPTHS